MKYYYDDPVAAAYMAKNFSMSLRHGTEGNSITIHDILGLEQFFPDGITEMLYILNESVELLIPHGGDVIINGAGWPKIVSKIDESTKEVCWTEHGKYHSCSIYDCKVIQRNGKPFFWPRLVQNEVRV